MSKFLPFNLFVRQALLYPLVAPFLPAIASVKKGIKYAAGLLTGTYECPPAGGLPKTGQTAVYQYGDDGDLKKGLPLTPPRFTDNEDGTITDNATGLMWVKEPGAIGGNFGSAGSPSDINWMNAIARCYALEYAGHSDWRLPNIFELTSIADFSTNSPAIDEDFFPSTQSSAYWASTTYQPSDTWAWYTHFGTGLTSRQAKTYLNFVRPVRLGQPPD